MFNFLCNANVELLIRDEYASKVTKKAINIESIEKLKWN